MVTLFLKSVRDLVHQRTMVLVISMLIMSGAGLFITLMSTYASLKRTQEAYYRDNAFADLFGWLGRAPSSVRERLMEIPGVARVETRVTGGAIVELEEVEDIIRGWFTSLPDEGSSELNRVHLREGRFPRPYRDDEVVAGDAFADARGLRTGDTFVAILNGRRAVLTVTGVGLSPEYIYQGNPGSIIPDVRTFGLFWMGRSAMEAAFDMKGSFNDITASFSPVLSARGRADGRIMPEEIVRRMDDVLDPYGGRGVRLRDDHPSHFFITEELRQLQRMSTIIPVIFLGIASFLLSVVIGRLIRLQRPQIAILKAFGYGNLVIGLHYGLMVGLIVLLGVLGGVGFGSLLGHRLAVLYAEYYRFPFLDFQLDAGVLLLAAGLSAGAAFSGVARAVWDAVSVPPAESMRPEEPPRYRPSPLERLGLGAHLDPVEKMVVRQLDRHRWKTILSIVGIGFAVALVMIGRMSEDAINQAVDRDFRMARPHDLHVVFSRPLADEAALDLARLPEVRVVEAARSFPVTYKHGHRSRTSTLEALPEELALRRLLDGEGRGMAVPGSGILLSRTLAEVLRIEPGMNVTVERLDGDRGTFELPVAGLTDQLFGMGGYVSMEQADRLAGDPRMITDVLMEVRDGGVAQVQAELRGRPWIASVTSTRSVIGTFFESTAQTWLIMSFFVLLFAGGTAFSVVYNHARISLSERSRELASLRILGLSRGDVTRIVLGELAVLVGLAIPVGMGLGWLLTYAIIVILQTELYRIPMNITPKTLSIATATLLVIAGISAVVVARRIHRLDLIGVLKTRAS